jgi:hypothetical protein
VSCDDEVLFCERCGAPLVDDPDDDPIGGPRGTPYCGECARNRDFATDFSTLDLADGELDGMIDW